VQTPTALAVPVLVWLLVLSGVDLREHRLPNALTIPGVFAVGATMTSNPWVAVGAAVAAAPYLVAVVIGGCGAGDLKLAVVAGALAGDVRRSSPCRSR
jgi:leader peptidase (prepilin peptidase)/N-methyltransferase